MPADFKNKHNNTAIHGRRRISILTAGVIATGIALGGCTSKQVFTNGAAIQEENVALVPVGSSKEQVLLALGSPSTTGTFDNEEVFYYISQKREKRFAFQKAKLVEQRVFAVYFNEDSEVERLADYGLQDGKVFDFITRTTPTGGKDQTFLGRILSGGQATPSLPGGGGGGIPGQ